MARAFKCDRCGKFFENLTRQFVLTERISDRDSLDYDLCPNCEGKLARFLSNLDVLNSAGTDENS